MLSVLVAGLLGGLFLSVSVAATDRPDSAEVHIYTENYPPYSYMTKAHTIDGVSTRIVEALMRETGLSYHMVLVPWTRAYRAALEEDNALIFTLARAPEREALFHWLVPLGTVRFYLFARNDDNRFEQEINLKDGKFRIACLIDDISCSLVDNLGVPEGNIFRIAEKNRPDVMLVLAKRADLYVAENIHNIYRLKRLGVPASSTKKVKALDSTGELYLAAGKQVRKEIRDAILAAMARLEAQGISTAITPDMIQNLPE